MLIASIILFALSIYFTACCVINMSIELVRSSALLQRPEDIRRNISDVVIVSRAHVIVTVLTWTAFYGVRVYA